MKFKIQIIEIIQILTEISDNSDLYIKTKDIDRRMSNLLSDLYMLPPDILESQQESQVPSEEVNEEISDSTRVSDWESNADIKDRSLTDLICLLLESLYEHCIYSYDIKDVVGRIIRHTNHFYKLSTAGSNIFKGKQI